MNQAMNNAMNDRCTCAACAGDACQCGCQLAAVQLSDARPACNCATACGCDAAEQGCLCQA
jgi:hypothetical protein